MVNVHVFNGSNGKNGTERGKFGNRGKGFCVVEVGLLGEALGNKTSLVPLNRTIKVLLDLEDPSRANSFSALWKWDQVPGFVIHYGLVLHLGSLNPLVRII